MADEAAWHDVLEAAGAVPGTLIVGEKHVAGGIEADAARGTYAAGGRNELAVRADLPCPAAVLGIAGERAGQAQREPDVAVLVEARTESVFVIITADVPAVGDDFEEIGFAVAVGVFDARQVAALGDVEPATPPGPPLRRGGCGECRKSQDFVETVREACELGLLGISGQGIVHEPDFAAARADREFAVGHEFECSAFEDLARRNVEAEHLVVVVFLRRLSALSKGDDWDQ